MEALISNEQNTTLKTKIRNFVRRVYRAVAVFSKIEIVECRLFNLLGLQVFRIILSRSILKFKRLLTYRVKDKYSDELIREGIVEIQNFLPEEIFKDLIKETNKIFENEKSEIVKPIGPEDLVMNSYFINKEYIEKYPIFKEFTNSEQISKIFKNVLGASYPITTWELQNLEFNETKNEIVDTQNILHIDTFFTNLKIFYYTHEIKKDEAPFVYVKGSHKFNLKMLMFHYLQSIFPQRAGSWSIPRVDYAKMGINPTLGTFKENSLVIADVSGLHGRGDSKPGVSRKTLKCVQRMNPFNIFKLS